MEFLNFNDTIFHNMGKNNTLFSSTSIGMMDIDGVVGEQFWKKKIIEVIQKYPKFCV